MKRKRIGWKTRCASLLLQLGVIPYDDAKQMTEDQILSLFHIDHYPILYETGHEDRDKFWNLTHRLIREHREKTKRDAKIIAKGRRIRERIRERARETAQVDALVTQINRKLYRPIRSRGFDKTLRKKMDGTVVKR